MMPIRMISMLTRVCLRDDDGNVTDYDIDNTWSNFVTGGEIDKLYTYSVDTDEVLPDLNHLSNNDEDDVSKPAKALDVDDLADDISSTIELTETGDLTKDPATGEIYIKYGADGGHEFFNVVQRLFYNRQLVRFNRYLYG